MKIIKYKKKNSNQYTVILSDKTSLSFYDDTIINFNLLGKKEITNEFLQEVIDYNKNYEAYYLALKDITTKLRTEMELIKKLKKKEYSVKNIKFAIDKLKMQGYINDDLYLKSFIADQVNLGIKGPNKIIFELKKMNFRNEQIDKYLSQYENDIWIDKITKIIEKKVKSNHNLSSVMLKNKIKKDLINLGYDSYLIEMQISSLSLNDDKNLIEKEFNKELKKLSRKYNSDELKFRLKNNLYKKGFSGTDIDNLLDSLG